MDLQKSTNTLHLYLYYQVKLCLERVLSLGKSPESWKEALSLLLSCWNGTIVAQFGPVPARVSPGHGLGARECPGASGLFTAPEHQDTLPAQALQALSNRGQTQARFMY